jgi:hypothetical protein
MLLVTSNFALINVGILAFVAGAALGYLRFACPVCGWTRREGKPGPFKYRAEVSVERTSQGFWATQVNGSDRVLHCTRTAALEDAIRRFVDARQDKPYIVGEPKKLQRLQ